MMFKRVTLKPARYLFVLALCVSLAVSLTTSSVYASADKVTICHKPGTAAEKTLEIANSALPAHLAHGDRAGECGQQVSAGCAAVNALVPDPQTSPNFYYFGISNLDFSPGEVLHADITISLTPTEIGNGAFAVIRNSGGDNMVIDFHYGTFDEVPQTISAAVNYTVVAGDDADGLFVGDGTSGGAPYTLGLVHFSCTPAS